MTKDRIGAALAVVAAVIGLVLVFDGRDSANNDTPSAPSPTSEVAPPGSGQSEQPAPTPTPADNDNDNN